MTQFEIELIRGPMAGNIVHDFPGGEPDDELFFNLEPTGSVNWQAHYKLHKVDLDLRQAVYSYLTDVRV